jgi:hypothetical protein
MRMVDCWEVPQRRMGSHGIERALPEGKGLILMPVEEA